MPRIGLVLAGGGARGSYQIGVWKLLREIGYEPSVVTGCSVGGLNGAVILQGDYEVACDIWSRISTDLVLDVDLEQMRRKGIEESPAWLAKEAINMGVDNINFSTLPGEWKSPYIHLDPEETLALVNQHLNPYVEDRTAEDLNLPH